jgi:hypothetical protein
MEKPAGDPRKKIAVPHVGMKLDMRDPVSTVALDGAAFAGITLRAMNCHRYFSSENSITFVHRCDIASKLMIGLTDPLNFSVIRHHDSR